MGALIVQVSQGQVPSNSPTIETNKPVVQQEDPRKAMTADERKEVLARARLNALQHSPTLGLPQSGDTNIASAPTTPPPVKTGLPEDRSVATPAGEVTKKASDPKQPRLDELAQLYEAHLLTRAEYLTLRAGIIDE
jgi:hypothetical protein